MELIKLRKQLNCMEKYYEFKIDNYYEIYGFKEKRIKFIVSISNFDMILDSNGIYYDRVNGYGEASYDSGYLEVIRNSFKYFPDYMPPRKLSDEDIDLIEIALNNSDIRRNVIKDLNKY